MSQQFITLTVEAELLIKKLDGYPTEMVNAIRRGMDKANALVVGITSRSRFTGKGPFPLSQGRLGVRTNRLRRSLRWNRATIGADGTVTGSIGTNVEYMAAHEFGFSGEVNVRAHQRSRFTAGGKLRGKKAERLSASTHEVRAHRRSVNLPERAPIRRGIEDGRATYADQITAQLRAAWEKKGAQT